MDTIGTLTAPQINKTRSLLHMWYTPGEIAEETGISLQLIRRQYIPAGLPHRREENGRIWIDGAAFAAWVGRNKKQRRKKLAPGQAMCMACKKAVEMQVVEVKPGANSYLETVHGCCIECGGKVVLMRKANGQS